MLSSFLIAFGVMLVLDACWLSFAGSRIYPRYIGHLLSKGENGKLKPNWLAAGLFYLMYIVVVYLLAIVPNLDASNLLNVFINGALIGLLGYGTYDLTNQATLKNWPWSVTVIDMIWGTLLTGTVVVLAVALS